MFNIKDTAENVSRLFNTDKDVLFFVSEAEWKEHYTKLFPAILPEEKDAGFKWWQAAGSPVEMMLDAHCAFEVEDFIATCGGIPAGNDANGVRKYVAVFFGNATHPDDSRGQGGNVVMIVTPEDFEARNFLNPLQAFLASSNDRVFEILLPTHMGAPDEWAHYAPNDTPVYHKGRDFYDAPHGAMIISGVGTGNMILSVMVGKWLPTQA